MNLPKQNHLSSASPGVSLIIAMILITILVLFSAGVTEVIVGANRNAVNILRSTQAYYAAESGLEEALAKNSALKIAGKEIGADESNSGFIDVAKDIKYHWSISGSASRFPQKKVNGNFIIPLPWTGNAPWHGVDSIPSTGGCDPQRAPQMTGEQAIDHPCNWSTLHTGEKVSIPLYSVNGGSTKKFTNFTLKLRTPCKDHQETCAATDRMELNCWDRGDSEKKCLPFPKDTDNPKRGEILVLWQIDAKDSNGNIVSLGPWDSVGSFTQKKYNDEDTELYEGKINYSLYRINSTQPNRYEVLSSGDPSIKGKQISNDNLEQFIQAFLKDNNLSEPVLTLTQVSNLVGCHNLTSCLQAYDSPKGSAPKTSPQIPYLEYQVVINDADDTNLPANNENIITAEGQSGQFVRTIQVRVPNNNTGLEYVIQQ